MDGTNSALHISVYILEYVLQSLYSGVRIYEVYFSCAPVGIFLSRVVLFMSVTASVTSVSYKGESFFFFFNCRAQQAVPFVYV